MKIFSTYKVKIKHYNHIFRETVDIYRHAVDYLIDVCLAEWDTVSEQKGKKRLTSVERLTHATSRRPVVKYPAFDRKFYKFPSYLRRAAINEAIGKVSSYKSSLENWESADPDSRGRKPSCPKAGYVYPCMYNEQMYSTADTYKAKIKVYVRNTWDWITVQLRKSDVDYINRRCKTREQCSPTLQKRGKEWFLAFPFEEKASLVGTSALFQTVIAIDLGINSAATAVAMRSDGTVLGRHFCRLTRENDCLNHAINRIKKAQQHGNRKMPRLWAKAKGINSDIAAKTAEFIVDVAVLYSADTIVFEHLERSGKKRGSKKQRLHMWKCLDVQSIVTDKAHRMGMRVRRICAWNTSRLAYDGSGKVLRGKEAGLPSYSVCQFQSGKIYNCDLSAAYNIGARYFIREILKSLPEKVRLGLEAKVPHASKRSTCTLSTLISLNAELASLAA